MPRVATFAVAAVLAAPLTALAQIPLGLEFQVNFITQYAQALPSVAVDAAGNFVVVWENFDPGFANQEVWGRRFDANGNALGSGFFVNTYATGTQYHARVAMDPSGNFMVVWQSNQPSNWNVYGRAYDATGTPRGPDFIVNTYLSGDQTNASVSADATGFVVVWQSEQPLGPDQDGDGAGVYARRFDSAGVPATAEFRLNAFTTGHQQSPSVASQGGGAFVAAWQSAGPDGSYFGIRARLFDAAGTALGGEFTVNSWTTGNQTEPAVAADAAGNFVVAWTSAGQESPFPYTGTGVFAQQFDASGVRKNWEWHVSTYTSGNQNDPAVAMDQAGGFVVTWSSQNEDGDSYGVFGRRWHVSGTGDRPPLAFNTYTTSAQFRPAVAAAPWGDFVAVWNSPQDGSGTAVVGRRFQPDIIFLDGFENGDFSPWSASATDGGDLTVSPAAGLRATALGMQGVVDDTAGLYVQDDSPRGEKHYRARFHLDPNGYDPGEALAHRRTRMFIAFTEPSRRVLAVVLRRLGGSYSVMARARLDDNSQTNTPFFPITDAPHSIEVELYAANGPDTNDGALRLFIDGTQVADIFGLDNSLSGVDFARLGALSVKAGASGTLYWDEFQSRRLSYIGW
jgi:hypothetical protein